MIDTQTKNKILKAIKSGCNITHIAKKVPMPVRTLWWKIKNEKEYQIAYNYRLMVIDNIFS